MHKIPEPIRPLLNWKNIIDCNVTINSDITKSEVVFMMPINIDQLHSNTDGTGKGTDGTKNGTEISLNDRALALISTNENISIKEIVNATGASKRTINRAISLLKGQNKLKRIGSARNGKWVFIIDTRNFANAINSLVAPGSAIARRAFDEAFFHWNPNLSRDLTYPTHPFYEYLADEPY